MVGIDRFTNWIYYRGDDMSRMSDLDIDRQDKEASNGDYSHEDCREPDQKDYTKQVMASEEYKADMEDLSDCCGASIVWTDICSDCKEHCGIEGEDEPEGDTPAQENEWLRSGGF